MNPRSVDERPLQQSGMGSCGDETVAMLPTEMTDPMFLWGHRVLLLTRAAGSRGRCAHHVLRLALGQVKAGVSWISSSVPCWKLRARDQDTERRHARA